MTLAPVFRSKESTEFLRERGVVARMFPHLIAQREAMSDLEAALTAVLGREYLHTEGGRPVVSDEEFLQDHFFLILFRSFFETLGARDRIDFYTQVNICIKGIITAADNLFDQEFKELIPLKLGSGKTFGSIMQLMSFERLLTHLGLQGARAGKFDIDQFQHFNRELLNRLAFIGSLEGSEEDGVTTTPKMTEMIDNVHRVRGGSLFSLAFAAPIEFEEDMDRWVAGEKALARLGTAFQIVDDLTDFEFDLHRRSHNLLCSAIMEHGTDSERAKLKSLKAAILEAGEEWEASRDQIFGTGDVIDREFSGPALEVLKRARAEARLAFEEMAALGFWFDPADSDEVVHAIVGLEGVRRMELLVEKTRVQS
jgi:hypothetical protein